jgi:hypothetical protein
MTDNAIISKGVAKMVCKGRYAMFQHPSHAIRVMCFDGKRRNVRLNIDADTAFSWPGRASIKGKTVRGYVTSYSLKGERDLFFIRYKSGDRPPEAT